MWQNNLINKSLITEINNLNSKFFSDIKSLKIEDIKATLAPELQKTLGLNLSGMVDQMTGILNKDSLSKLDEFYICNPEANAINTLSSNSIKDSDYTLKYKSINKETYVCLFLSSGTPTRVLITIVYGKYKNEWKINILNFGQYSLFGKNAPEYYQIAQYYLNQNELYNAFEKINACMICLHPSKNIFQYKVEPSILELNNLITTKIKETYQFPIVISEIPSKPKIFEIYPYSIPEGFYPMVQYLSTIQITDTIALAKENQAIQNILPGLFPGINRDKKYIFYSAYNEFPEPHKETLHYGFIQDIPEK